MAGIGGHADFCAAATRSPAGSRSSPSGQPPVAGSPPSFLAVDVVSTPRCDVEVVVTEHGVADLRGVDDDERARRIVRVAAPDHRAWLDEARHRQPGVPPPRAAT